MAAYSEAPPPTEEADTTAHWRTRLSRRGIGHTDALPAFPITWRPPPMTCPRCQAENREGPASAPNAGRRSRWPALSVGSPMSPAKGSAEAAGHPYGPHRPCRNPRSAPRVPTLPSTSPRGSSGRHRARRPAGRPVRPAHHHSLGPGGGCSSVQESVARRTHLPGRPREHAGGAPVVARRDNPTIGDIVG